MPIIQLDAIFRVVLPCIPECDGWNHLSPFIGKSSSVPGYVGMDDGTIPGVRGVDGMIVAKIRGN